MTLGFSTLLDADYRKCLGFAKALTDTKLFVQDHEMGFLIMRRIANIIHKRLQITKTQLVDLYQ